MSLNWALAMAAMGWSNLALAADAPVPAASAPLPFTNGAATMPQVKLMCVGYTVRDDRKETAQHALDSAMEIWKKTATIGGIVEAGTWFIEGDRAESKEAAFPMNLRLCAGAQSSTGDICDLDRYDRQNKPVEVADLCLRPLTRKAVVGTAGYCPGAAVEGCLTDAAKIAGYDPTTGWRRFPVYAPWPADTPPTSAQSVADFLATTRTRFNKPDNTSVRSGEARVKQYSFDVRTFDPTAHKRASAPAASAPPRTIGGLVWFFSTPPTAPAR
jgi:hypothetical protein